MYVLQKHGCQTTVLDGVKTQKNNILFLLYILGFFVNAHFYVVKDSKQENICINRRYVIYTKLAPPVLPFPSAKFSLKIHIPQVKSQGLRDLTSWGISSNLLVLFIYLFFAA
jgi:hypothetical protein